MFVLVATKYPEVSKIPLIGQASEQSVSAERILSLRPDLVIFLQPRRAWAYGA